MIIGGKEYKLRWSLRGMFLYEQATGHAYPRQEAKMQDIYLLFYGMAYAANKDFPYNFDEFCDLCDEDPALFDEFTEMMNKKAEKDALWAEGKKKAQTESL